jgi:TatD DNase family protein
VVTFKNARHSLEVASDIPLDRLLLETDAPYMAPVPYRGKRNDSTLLAPIAQRIAELRGTTAEEIAARTLENGLRFFNIQSAAPKG